jgi:thiol-disulfide isomerase/thioredoxin
MAFSVLHASRAGGQPAPATQPASGPQPVAKADEPFHDFGSVIEGQKLSHRFTIVNDGAATLQIERIVPSCGCMTVGAHPRAIEPGKSGEYPITLDTANLLGIFTKSAEIYTNDPITPKLSLMVRGEGRRLIEVVPVSAGFGRIAEERVHQQVVTITNRSEKPMTLTIGNAYKAGKFQFDLVESIPGVEYKLFVVLRPPLPEGTVRGSVILHSNNELQKTVEVTAAAIVLSKVEIMPNILYLSEPPAGGPAAGKPFIKTLEFSSRGEKPLHLVDTRVDDPDVRVSHQELEPGRLYRLLVSFPAGYRPPAEGRTITLETSDAATPTLRVPIRQAGVVVKPGQPAATTQPSTTPPAPAKSPTTRSAVAPKKPVMDLIGGPAPEFALATISGRPLGGTEFKNHPATVLNFVAPNCGYCKRQVPTIERMRADYEPRGVRFVNVSETMRGKVFTSAESQAAFDQMGSRLELAMDPGNNVGRQFKVGSFPILVVVGKDGLIADAFPGATADLSRRVPQRLESLLAAEVLGITGNPSALKH